MPGTGDATATSGDVLMIDPPASRCEWGRLSELDRWCLRCRLVDVGVDGREADDWRIDSPAKQSGKSSAIRKAGGLAVIATHLGA